MKLNFTKHSIKRLNERFNEVDGALRWITIKDIRIEFDSGRHIITHKKRGTVSVEITEFGMLLKCIKTISKVTREVEYTIRTITTIAKPEGWSFNPKRRARALGEKMREEQNRKSIINQRKSTYKKGKKQQYKRW